MTFDFSVFRALQWLQWHEWQQCLQWLQWLQWPQWPQCPQWLQWLQWLQRQRFRFRLKAISWISDLVTQLTNLTDCETWIMTLRVNDWQSKSDLVSICNSCDATISKTCTIVFSALSDVGEVCKWGGDGGNQKALSLPPSCPARPGKIIIK